MTRKELVDSIQAAIVAESAMAIAIENMTGTFAWSGLAEDVQQKVVDDLEKLSSGPRRRAEQLKKMVGAI